MFKILIVDDDENGRYLLKINLEKRGFATIEGQHGKEGLDLWLRHANEIRLVISDYDMPLMSGDDMVITARSLNLFTPAIILSGVDRECQGDVTFLRRGDFKQIETAIIAIANQ